MLSGVIVQNASCSSQTHVLLVRHDVRSCPGFMAMRKSAACCLATEESDEMRDDVVMPML